MEKSITEYTNINRLEDLARIVYLMSKSIVEQPKKLNKEEVREVLKLAEKVYRYNHRYIGDKAFVRMTEADTYLYRSKLGDLKDTPVYLLLKKYVETENLLWVQLFVEKSKM